MGVKGRGEGWGVKGRRVLGGGEGEGRGLGVKGRRVLGGGEGEGRGLGVKGRIVLSVVVEGRGLEVGSGEVMRGAEREDAIQSCWITEAWCGNTKSSMERHSIVL